MSMGEWIRTSRGRWTIILAVVGLASVLLVAVVTLGSGHDLTFFGIPLVEAGGKSDADRVVITGPDGRELPNNATGSSDGSGSSGSGEPDGDDDGAVDEGPSAAELGVDEMEVLILWWNDTEEKAPIGFSVGFEGYGSWEPDPDEESMRHTLGPLPIGEPLTLVVLPDGPDGTRVEVPIGLESRMIPGSERDAIHVEVGDDHVRVLGNPVDNFDETYAR